jgi:hypothetical protein
MAWNALADRYAPKKTVDRQTLVTELIATKLDNEKDPELWIIELQRMLSKLHELGENISDGLLMAHFLGSLPKEYEKVFDNLANQDNKTFLSVMVTPKDKFERLRKSSKSSGSNGEAILMSYKKFSGDCSYCGRKGHKAADCSKKRENEGQKKVEDSKEKKHFLVKCHVGKRVRRRLTVSY